MSKINPNNLTAANIRNAMLKKWAAPEWAVMFEVNQGTGAGSGRSADAVMMSLWPSRGLELHGVEIKVSRSDWKREAKDPTKAEAIAQYCDRWWIHTPVGVVDDISDMPPAWGLREYTGRQWKTIREAEKTEAKTMDRKFLASLLRRSDESMKSMARDMLERERNAMNDRADEDRQRLQKEIQRQVDRRTSDYVKLLERVTKYENITGITLEGYGDVEKIGRCAKYLSDAAQSDFKGLLQHSRSLESASKALKELHDIASGGDE